MPPQQIHEIPIKKIEVDDENVRQSEADRELEELAASIKKHGQLQPVVLRGEPDKPPYKLIIGQRRFLAQRDILKTDKIKAIFAGKISDTDAAIRSLAENMCRVELSYADTAKAITSLYTCFNRDARRVARETGLSLQKVRDFVYIDEMASDKTKKKLAAKRVKREDVKRALKAASGNIGKADELLDLMQQYKDDLDPNQKKRIVTIAAADPKASAAEIMKRAREPVVEQSFVVKLSDRARKGLLSAAKTLAMAPDEVAARAVEEWLSSKGFVS
jgi:ParB family chromosome partitioning protein